MLMPSTDIRCTFYTLSLLSSNRASFEVTRRGLFVGEGVTLSYLTSAAIIITWEEADGGEQPTGKHAQWV